MKTIAIAMTALAFSPIALTADWDGIPIPADPGVGNKWELQSLSDDFNYDAPAIGKSERFYERWSEGFINPWLGPDLTEFHGPNSSVENGNLIIKASRKPGAEKIHTGAIHSKESLTYPLYMEARVKITNLTLANAFWLLSADSTQEIDVLETYGSDRPSEVWFDQRIHLSHHVFIRDPFQDYQPKDPSTWYAKPDGGSWRDDYVRVGTYWKDPWTLEYYVNGELVRLSSGADVIDPYGFTNGTGLSKPMQAIFDAEHQGWRDIQGTLPPSDEELADPARNKFQVDWVRFYKPVPDETSCGPKDESPGYSSVEITVEMSDYASTGKEGSPVAWDTVHGFNRNGENINYNTLGDWAEYQVAFPRAGFYWVTLAAATPTPAGTAADVQLNGSFEGTISVSNTGGWEKYRDFELDSAIYVSSAGVHMIRVQSSGGAAWQWNGDEIRFTRNKGQSLHRNSASETPRIGGVDRCQRPQ